MAKIKLTKSAVDAAQPQAKAVELLDTVVPGFLCKITPVGRKVFMLQYRTNAGERRKPALGQHGELTVDQARTMAQEWPAEVRKGGDPSVGKNAARKAPAMKEFCHTFMRTTPSNATSPARSAATLPCSSQMYSHHLIDVFPLTRKHADRTTVAVSDEEQEAAIRLVGSEPSV